MNYAVETKGISKYFKGEAAVDNVNLKVSIGKVYGLLGPNGSGKSTLIKMILGLIPPSKGEVIIDSNNLIKKRIECLRKVSVVLDNQGIYLDLSARKNLEIVAHIYEKKLDDINDVMTFVGLGDVGNKKAVNFSLGMKQRLALACALLPEPELLILDEPTNGLDTLGIHEIKKFIKGLSAKGVTVLITSHVLADIDELCDDIGILNEGRLVYQGTLTDLKRETSSQLILKVDNPEVAIELLRKDFEVTKAQQETHLIIQNADSTTSSIVNKLLVTNNINVFSLSLNSKSLEDAVLSKVSK